MHRIKLSLVGLSSLAMACGGTEIGPDPSVPAPKDPIPSIDREICDGVDNDSNGLIDDGVAGCEAACLDDCNAMNTCAGVPGDVDPLCGLSMPELGKIDSDLLRWCSGAGPLEAVVGVQRLGAQLTPGRCFAVTSVDVSSPRINVVVHGRLGLASIAAQQQVAAITVDRTPNPGR